MLSEGGRLEHTPERRGVLTARLVDVEARVPDQHPAERILALSALSDQASHAGQVEETLDYSERALVLAQKLDDEEPLRSAASARSFALHIAGRHFESRLLLEAVVELARRTGSPLEEARALMMFGTSVYEDDPRAALESMLECAVLSGRAGVRPLQGLALANASEGAVDLGEWDVADRALAEAALLTREESMDDDGGEMTVAMLTAYRGDPVVALAALDDLEARRGDAWQIVLMRTWFLRVRGLCRFLAGDPRGAIEDGSTSLARDPSGANAPTSLWVAVQAACALADATAIRAAVEVTVGLRGRWTELVRATATAAEAALEHGEDAPARMEAVLNNWLAAELPLDHALATLCAVQVLPAADVPAGHVGQARAYLTDLHAQSLLRLFDAARQA